MTLAFLNFGAGFTGLAIWFWLLILISVVWLKRHIDLNRARHQRYLTPGDANGPDPLPSLTMLVAAKDEEQNIARCIRGLLAQEYPALAVIAINDRSTDATGRILDQLAAAETRLKVLHVKDLPPGWAGKCHAMAQGVPHAAGDYLCFTDADCEFHSPQLLAAAVRLCQREKVEFLSVLPELEASSFWERMIQPAAGAIMVFWFPPEKVNNPARPQAYANGAFMLLQRPAYDRIGGHAAVAASTNEDLRLAALAKQLGVRLYVLPGGGMYTVRMYTGLRAIWNGWTRIFYGSFGSWPRLIASAAFLLIFSLLAPLSLLLSPLAGAAGLAIAVAAAWTVLVQQTVLWRFYRFCALPRHWALTYPLGAALCLAIILNAMRRRAGAPLVWRGTTYQTSQPTAPAAAATPSQPAT